MSRPHRRTRIVDALLAVVSIAAVLGLVAVALLVYNKAFQPTVDVALRTDSMGNMLQDGSDVKYHGVPVGQVETINPTPTGATVALALEPDAAAELSTATVARLLPKTLFGERYVALREPEGNSAGASGLSTGDTIHQDSSSEAAELQEVLDELLPMLRKIQPAKLSAMLGEFATMLREEGQDLGDALVTWHGYLDKLNPKVPQMTEDLQRLADVASDYEKALPDLLNALDSMTVTSATLAEKRTELRDLYANVISAGDTTTDWVRRNRNTIEILSEQSRAALNAIRPYAGEFPCLFEAAADFIPVMDDTLGAGTDEPGMHVRLTIVPSRGKYLPGKDAPSYAAGGEPRCPYVDGKPGTRHVNAPKQESKTTSGKHTSGKKSDAAPERIAPPPSRLLREHLAATVGLGPANSPGENQLIAELIAPTQGMAPSDYPQWSSLLLGPTLRNTKVVLQ